MKQILDNRFYQQPSPPVGFEDLRNDLKKRSYGFEFHKTRLENNPRLLHWIGSVDRSGFVREKSLDYLIANYSDGDENRILLRLEDWVNQIWYKADVWIRENFEDLSLNQILDSSKVILYLTRKDKSRNFATIYFINTCILEKLADIDINTFRAIDPVFRQYIYSIDAQREGFLREWLSHDIDPNIRLSLIKLYGSETLTQHEHALFLQDKSSFVKLRYLRALIKSGNSIKHSDLLELITDKHRGIRELAQFYLSRDYKQDAYELYKAKKDSSYYYIADYAKVSDLSIFLEGSKSKTQKTRYLSLKAISKIDATLLKSLNIKQLVLENTKTRHVITQQLPKILAIDELKTFKEVYGQVFPNGKLLYLKMVLAKSFWHFADEALQVLIEENPSLHFEYISNRLLNQKYTYQKLDPTLKTALEKKLTVLEETYPGEKHFIEHTRFLTKGA